jgi:hypothetical protein
MAGAAEDADVEESVEEIDRHSSALSATAAAALRCTARSRLPAGPLSDQRGPGPTDKSRPRARPGPQLGNHGRSIPRSQASESSRPQEGDGVDGLLQVAARAPPRPRLLLVL